MKCRKCGNECAEGALFCTECGSRFDAAASTGAEKSAAGSAAESSAHKPDAEFVAPASAQGAKKKKHRDNIYIFGTVTRKTFIIAAAVVAALLLVAISAIMLVNHAINRSGYTVEVNTRFAAPTPPTLVDSDGRLYDLSEYGIVSYDIYSSLDGDTAAILGRAGSPDAGGALLLLQKTALSKIADGVTDCAVSDNGAAVAYTVSGGETASLYLYDAKSKSSSLVSGGIPPYDASVITGPADSHGAFVLSPDGRSIAFTRQVNNGGVRLYVSVKGSEPVAVATDSYPVALSNGGKYIYYLKQSISATEYNYKFSVAFGDDIRNLSLDAAYLGRDLIFNADRTEVVFYDGGSTYVSRKAGERRKITGYAIDALIVPGDGAARTEELGFSGRRVSVYARKTVAGSVFSANGGLYYLNSGFEISCMTARSGGCAISPNGRSIYYIDASGSADPYSGKVYYLESIEKTGKKKLVSGELEAAAVMAPDKFDGFYILDPDDTLYFASRSGNTQKRIADEIMQMNVDPDGGGIYFTTELEDGGTVWYSNRGAKKKEVVRAGRAAIESAAFMPRAVFFRTYVENGAGELNAALCRVTSGKKYETAFEYLQPTE